MRTDLYPLIAQMQLTYDSVAVPLALAIKAAGVIDQHPWDARPLHIAPLIAVGGFNLESQLRKLRAAYVKQALALVSESLGRHGAPLELIDSEDIVGAFIGSGDASAPALVLKGLVDALMARYAPSAASMARSQAADACVALFALNEGAAPIVRSGCAVLSLDMYLRFASAGTPKSYSNGETLVAAALAIAQVLSEIRPELASGLMRDAEGLAVAGRRNRWEPARNGYGPIGPVQLRAFHSKVEFVLPLSLAAQVNLYLSEHATAFRTAAAA